ncbi:MAG TPA: 4-alpha-glucanotransferase [Planctomycetota bacterium]|nr:4-alpha-glucanotransferase [Planctomycetota bacterium]HRR81624.1 4-alpha-glucanotransferase [Planctomycetota bacterium]HRT97333.1 4-alpha-glucanotransferase [Planctomycetota bacterium]
MRFPRSAGILLHPTSLPGRFGIGELGYTAHRFADFLAESGQSLWQILPLGPTGYGDSPYACFSAFAGNPFLLNLDWLASEGDLEPSELASAPRFPEEHVDFGWVYGWRNEVFPRAAARFRRSAVGARRADFDRFCYENAAWLDDYALFRALKDAHGGAVWSTWPEDLATRQPAALARARERLADAVFTHCYLQYQFLRQWSDLKRHANAKGIRIVGDIPIFVAFDSADVWAHPELFFLGPDLRPSVVAGVPPDYFSRTGQLWGNPLYRWDTMAADGFAWWVQRFRQTFRTVDIVRLDHFRGFAAYWEVPAGEETAINGRWVKGPGARFFEALKDALGELPIIAEDLGLITPDVEALRQQFEFPGMKVLQFAFTTDGTHPYLPHRYERNCIVYTGTHDNDTTLGWYHTREAKEKAALHRYLGPMAEPVNWALTRLAYESVADVAIVPLQDVLGLGGEARMNTPGQASGNWSWRFREDALTAELRGRLLDLALAYGRKEAPRPKEEAGKEPESPFPPGYPMD